MPDLNIIPVTENSEKNDGAVQFDPMETEIPEETSGETVTEVTDIEIEAVPVPDLEITRIITEAEVEDEIAEMTEALDGQFFRMEENGGKGGVEQENKNKKTYIFGSASGAASLVFMGISLLIAGGRPDRLGVVLGISPIILIFLGIEWAVRFFIQKASYIRFTPFDFGVAAALICISFGLSSISLSAADKGEMTEYLHDRFTAEAEGLILAEMEKTPETASLIGKIELSVRFADPFLSEYNNIGDLSFNDNLILTLHLNPVYRDLISFGEDCRILAGKLAEIPLPLKSVAFLSETRNQFISAELDVRLQKHLTAEDIAERTYYYSEAINPVPARDEEDLVAEE